MNGISCIKLSDCLWQFCDSAGFRCHLLTGSRYALLIDTMGGCGNLRQEVEKITDLPVTVALTHCHFDHIGGTIYYPKVWLPISELAGFKTEMEHIRKLRHYLAELGVSHKKLPKCLNEGSTPIFIDIKEEDTFDLGGITVRVVALPGHTVGSVGYLCEEKGLLFVGDAATPVMCLFFENSLTIEEYRATLAKMYRLSFTHFLTSHHARMFPKKVLLNFDACAEFAETDRGMYFQHDFLPDYMGTLHVYRGISSKDDNFLALISKYEPREKRTSHKKML